MMKTAYLGLAAAAAVLAAPAGAATVVFNTTGTPTTTAASQTVTSGTQSATFTGGTYTGTVAAMNSADGNVALTSGQVRKSSSGMGVGPDGESDQVDSNGANELLQVVFGTPGRFRIVSAEVGMIDTNDTFALFGGQNGVYNRLGFTGTFANGGISGGIPVTTTSLGGGRYRLDFNYGGGFDSFRFGTNNESADGFSLRSLSVAAVPEPSTWAMLILGFGLVGGALRRQQAAATKARRGLVFA